MSQSQPNQPQMVAPPSSERIPPSASSPCDIVVHEGGGESAPGGDHSAPPAVELPAFLQEALQSIQD